MLRKFCMINRIDYKQANKKNSHFRVVIPKSKFNEIFQQFYEDILVLRKLGSVLEFLIE